MRDDHSRYLELMVRFRRSGGVGLERYDPRTYTKPPHERPRKNSFRAKPYRLKPKTGMTLDYVRVSFRSWCFNFPDYFVAGEAVGLAVLAAGALSTTVPP